MELISGEVVALISYLLPGFLATWVFHGLTAHPKQTPFERVVQALIFTAIVQSLTAGFRWWYPFQDVIVLGGWTEDADLVCSGIIAVLVGLIFAVFANKNWFHGPLYWLKVTRRTSYPSEWFSAFNRDERWVILHLEGDRRLYGWPAEWPDSGDTGHFVIMHAAWILDDNDCVPLALVERMVIPASTVKMVELMKEEREVKATAKELADAETKLVMLHKKGDDNGKQSSTTPADAAQTALPAGASGSVGPAIATAGQADGVPATPTEKVNPQNPTHQTQKSRAGEESEEDHAPDKSEEDTATKDWQSEGR